MTSRAKPGRDTSLATYAARRQFAQTPEPKADKPVRGAAKQPIFVVQQHHARRLHWDFRLQQGDVLWSWAVPKGPSMEVGVKRLAVRTEDHPLAYATFEGTIPEGNYGAGQVLRWDSGTWQPAGDPAAGLAGGELKFTLRGDRLSGAFVLVRMKPRPNERGENWLLIKERDQARETGRASRPVPAPPGLPPPGLPPPGLPPMARRAALPRRIAPQLATTVEQPPRGGDWLHEIKFDGYRLLVRNDGKQVHLMTRGGHDWTARLPGIAREASGWGRAMLVDGELIAVRADGVSDFGALQARLAEGKDRSLVLQVFDLLHLDGRDLTRCRLDERKALLATELRQGPRIRLSTYLSADAETMRQRACAMGLEGIISKRADAPYTPGRSTSWIKLKCQGREEFIVLGFTPPAGSRVGIGALHVGYRDPEGQLHYAGGVGTGFDDGQLAQLARQLRNVTRRTPPSGLVVRGEPPDPAIRWVAPSMVIEVRYGAWSASGRLRHAVFLGPREDKAAADVVRPVANDQPGKAAASQSVVQVRPQRRTKPRGGAGALPKLVLARAPVKATLELEGVRLTHPDRALWPDITKRQLAAYWRSVAAHALPGLARRPLALVRFPTGISGESFFQKHAQNHAMPGQPGPLRAATSRGDPYLAIDDVAGLVACAQLSAIELHAWGATEDDPDHPDHLVFDLDPGDGVSFAQVVQGAHTVRDMLSRVPLPAYCRTTGGKGLHVVAPLAPRAGWPEARAFAKAFAETLASQMPDRFVATLPRKQRRGRILIDWLRNGRGATAIGSFSPRGRDGATVATPLAWREVTKSLDPRQFSIATVPKRLQALRRDPWQGFEQDRAPLPRLGKGAG